MLQHFSLDRCVGDWVAAAFATTANSRLQVQVELLAPALDVATVIDSFGSLKKLHGYELKIVTGGVNEQLRIVTHSEQDMASQRRYCTLPMWASKTRHQNT